MERWEYQETSFILDLHGLQKRRQESHREFLSSLNSWGSEGWEMVGFEATHGKKAVAFLVIFKRRVPELEADAA